ncbi:MAG: ADP-ribosylglycohydrolase family protein [Muribaculaceae bacterium]|nr:ADP-ribosylglycohydrolase family protein [Muribaculaceae bacterium]
MLGAIAGDIIGSPFEYVHHRDYDFPLLSEGSYFTDDTVMTLAVARWLTESESLSDSDLIKSMLEIGRKYPDCGYGGKFFNWLWSEHPLPNNSYGNGSAMRVSPVALYAQNLNETLELAYVTAAVSHNHPEGIKGAQATAAAIYMARNGYSKDQIRELISAMFGYNMFRSFEEIYPGYRGSATCQGCVPESIICALEGDDFEDVIRKVVSLGGDTDTMGAIAGSIAACFYPIPEWIATECEKRLTPDLLEILHKFESFIGSLNKTYD